jgi:transposase
MQAFCGIDWAEDHHDIAIINPDGRLLSRARIGNDPAGLQRLVQLLSDAGDSAQAPIPVAIETTRGLLVACLRTTRPVYAINPMAVARYRERYSVARAKSDHGDALVLANILRTDAATHRPLPADSERAQAVTVLARAQQDAVWACQQLANQLRTVLVQYFPAAIAVFCIKHVGLTSREARTILAAAPTPTRAAKLTRAQLRALLRRAGRRRNLDTWAQRLQTAFRAEQLHQPPLVERAMGQHTAALVAQLSAACRAAQQQAQAPPTTCRPQPDPWSITSLPGQGEQTAARVLAETGDDRTRFADARALKAYAGAAPVTRASGKRHRVMARKVKTQRLAHVGYIGAFAALTASPGARAHYDRRRAAGDHHPAAQRHLFNRFLGILHHCRTTRQAYLEDKAFSAANPPQLDRYADRMS